MKPLSTPPFYAMEICECQTNTQGGPERNKDNQTIGNDGKPIPRLYTVGELGSIYGFLYNGGGNVPEAYATGRIAAKHAVTLKPWDAKA
jgi:succinate dehydrogenase/fumarate reductase flavoprotein subunit